MGLGLIALVATSYAQDADGDLVADAVEIATGCMDPNSPDSDGDGVPDGEEVGTGATIPNTDLANGSPHADDLIDPCDMDDDGDGLPTSVEAGRNTDAPFNLSPALQTIALQLGLTIGDDIPDHLDADDDGDSIPTWLEDLDGDRDPSNDDTDGDAIPNAHDFDDDGDFIDTYVELVMLTDPLNPDSDYDTVRDDIEWGCPDGVCVPPYQLLNPRNTDAEANGGLGAWMCSFGPQGNWVPAAGNADPLIDPLDSDDDNDGLPTGFVPAGGMLPEGDHTVDTDGDGIPDHRDLDSDGDSFLDLDGDGIPETGPRPDVCEGSSDSDNDTIPNFVDQNDFDGEVSDPDGDNLSTELELLLGLNPGDPDSDSDGVNDCAETTPAGWVHPISGAPSLCREIAGPIYVPESYWSDQNAVAPDTDGDGTIDALDVDDDGDGISTEVEVYQAVNPDGTLGVDFMCPNAPGSVRPDLVFRDPDMDGVFEHLYLCPYFDPNDPFTVEEYVLVDPDAIDRDADGLPNRLDDDDDNDGIPTFGEYNANPFAMDTDGDGIVNYLDFDDFDGPLFDDPDIGDTDDTDEPEPPIPDEDPDEDPDVQDTDEDFETRGFGCSCRSSGGTAGWVGLLALALLRRR